MTDKSTSILSAWYHRTINRLTKSSENRAYLLKGSIGTFGLQGASILLGFVSTWIFAKLLGVEQYGVYTYLLSWLAVLGTLAAMGTESYMVKTTAAYRTAKQNGLLKGAGIFSVFVVVGVSLLIILITWFTLRHWDKLWFYNPNSLMANPQNRHLLVIILWSLPFIALARVFEGLLRGAKFVISSQLPEMLVKPILLLMFIAIAYFLQGRSLDITDTIVMQIISVVLVAIAYFALFLKKFPHELIIVQPQYQPAIWTRGMFSFLSVSILSIINVRADLLLLGSLATAADVGIYNIAARLADIPKTILIAANLVMAPMVAEMYAKQDLQRLQKLLTLSVRLITVSGIPFILLYIFFGTPILKIWGTAFGQGYFALVCLGGAQLFNLAMGSVGMVLMMSGHERWVSYGLALGTGVNILLNILLIPTFGLNGAAIASLATTVVWNVFLAGVVIKKLNIDPTILGVLGDWGRRKGIGNEQ